MKGTLEHLNQEMKTKAMTRVKEGHYVIVKGVDQQEDITLVNIYAPNTGAPKYVRKILDDFKKEINSNTVIGGDFNTPLTTMDRSSKQRINKNTVALNNTLDKMDLTGIYRTFNPKGAKYTFFANACESFSKVDHMVGHKISLKNFKKIKIISSIFSGHNVLKLEPNPKEKAQKHSNT